MYFLYMDDPKKVVTNRKGIGPKTLKRTYVQQLAQLTYIHTYLQYGVWATSKELPCLHKAYYTPEVHTQIQVVRCKL